MARVLLVKAEKLGHGGGRQDHALDLVEAEGLQGHFGVDAAEHEDAAAPEHVEQIKKAEVDGQAEVAKGTRTSGSQRPKDVLMPRNALADLPLGQNDGLGVAGRP